MTPEARIRAAWQRLKASINAYHNQYNELRDVCMRINTTGGEA